MRSVGDAGRWALGLWVWAQAGSAVAQPQSEPEETGATTAQYRLEDVEVNHTVTPEAENIDVVSSTPVTVVDRAAVEEAAARNAGDVLQRIPGVFLDGSANQRGQNQVASIRGLDTKYTLVLIDGQRVAKTALDGGYDLSRIPANAIERIEIIKGPQAILLGGDAIGGVINIITRRTIDATQAAIEGGYGTFYTRAVEGSGQTRLGPVGVSSRVRWEASDGWTDAWDRDLDLQRDYPKNAGRPTARTFAEVGLSGKPTSAVTLRQLAQVVVAETVVSGYTDRQSDAGSSFGSRDATDVDLQATAIYEPAPNQLWQLDLSWFRHDTTVRVGRDKVISNSGQIASYNFQDERQDITHQLAGFQLRHRRALGSRQLLTIRAEARGEWRDSDNQIEEEGRDPEGRIVRRATFQDAHRIYELREIFFGLAVLDEIFLTDAWTVAPGIRVDGTDYWGTVVLPNVTTLYQTTSWLQLRYSMGAGYRRPTFESRTLPPYPVQDLDGQRFLVGNPDLLPEWSVGQEASATVYLGRATPSGAGGLGGLAQPPRSGELTLAFFRNDFWNKIEERQAGFYDFGDGGVGTPDERPEVPVVTEANVGRARTQGIEFSINATPIQRWTLGGNATWTSAKHLSDGRPLEGVPPLTANVFTSVRVPWTESSVRFAAIYSSKWERLDVNGLPRRQGPTPSRIRLDAQLVQPMGEHLSLRVEVENLANNRWDRDNDGDTDTPPRTWFATVRGTY